MENWDFKCAAFLQRSSVTATDLPLVSDRRRQTHGEREARAVNLCHVHIQQMYFKKEGGKSPVSSPCLLLIFTAKQTWFPNRAPVLKCSQQLNKHPDHTVKNHMKYVVVKWGDTIGRLLSYSFPKTTCLLLLSREHGLYQYMLNEHDRRGWRWLLQILFRCFLCACSTPSSRRGLLSCATKGLSS